MRGNAADHPWTGTVFAVLFIVSGSTVGLQAHPHWLVAAAYVRYNQVFRWDEGNTTRLMVWNVTGLLDNIASVKTTSYTFNVTKGQVVFFPVAAWWKVNAATREIVGVESGDNVTGHLMPFWMDPNASVGSSVDAYFGTYASVNGAQTIEALGSSRDCPNVILQWPSATMQRWYDKSTGVVLRIQTSMVMDGVPINITETAVQSNILALAAVSGAPLTDVYVYVAAVLAVAGVASVGLTLARRKARPGLRDPMIEL